MAATLLYHALTFLSLFSYGLYHLISATRSFLKPSSSSYTPRPYHPLPIHHHHYHFLRHLPLCLLLLSLLLSILHHSILFSNSAAANTNSISSLQTAFSLLFFLFIAFALFLSLPPDLIFLLSSLSFAILASTSSAYNPSDLQSKLDSISSLISAFSAAFCLALALSPRLFLSELALAGSVCLQGLWSLQTVFVICVDRFVPEGCHRLLEVRDGAVRCELEEFRVRAARILDFAFVVCVVVVAVVAVAVYGAVGWSGSGGGFWRRCGGGGYEALPTSSSNGGVGDSDHVQMKAMGKNSMQA